MHEHGRLTGLEFGILGGALHVILNFDSQDSSYLQCSIQQRRCYMGAWGVGGSRVGVGKETAIKSLPNLGVSLLIP